MGTEQNLSAALLQLKTVDNLASALQDNDLNDSLSQLSQVDVVTVAEVLVNTLKVNLIFNQEWKSQFIQLTFLCHLANSKYMDAIYETAIKELLTNRVILSQLFSFMTEVWDSDASFSQQKNTLWHKIANSIK